MLAVGPGNLLADGFFVVPKFVWDKFKDINEPTQKAIIVHDAGREELVLQVKYDGPVDEFGWLIPVPNLPTVKKGSMQCFYELSKYTQKNLEPRRYFRTLSAGNTHGGEEPEPPVKVIEVKTVGAYDIAVLSTKDSAALESWLQTNQFSFPADAAEVIDSYVKQHWYFIAVKINLKSAARVSTTEKLASGELHPLQISFASERCVFPLKISSLNHTPTEVQVYVLSPEPLVEKRLFEKELSGHYLWRSNQLAERRELLSRFPSPLSRFPGRSGGSVTNVPPFYPEPDHELSDRSEVNDQQLLPYAQTGRKDTPVCAREIALLNQRPSWWLTKQTWTFQPEEMRDLEFEPAIPVFTGALADSEGAFAAANLLRLGTNGASALIAAMRSRNPAVRAHAASAAEKMFIVSQVINSGPGDPAMNQELVRLLPTLLNDPDPEVRLHAVEAAMQLKSPMFFEAGLKLLRDDCAEVSAAARSYLREQREELPKHIPLFRQMLKDTNVNVQIAGFQLLSASENEIPREDLVALFSVPRMELAGAAAGRLKSGGISNDEAKPLLHNSLWLVRMIGLAVLMGNTNSQSVELAIPLLRDHEEVVQVRAYNLLTDLTGQNFPIEQPEQWEQWWDRNKATFTVTISQEELREKQSARRRQRQRLENDSPR